MRVLSAWLETVRAWPWPKTLLVAATLILLGGLAYKFHKDEPNEFDDVYRKAAAAMRDGRDVYRDVPLYTYPPFMAWGLIPFSYLDRVPARIGWFIVNASCLLAMAWLAWRLVVAPATNEQKEKVRWFSRGLWLVFAFGLFLGFRPGTNSVLHHQTDLLMGTFILAGLWCVQRRWPHVGAISIGLAGAMKCTPVLFAVWFLWRGPRMAAVTLIAVALGANMLPQLTNPPPDGHVLAQTWFDSVVAKLMKPGAYPGHWNVDVMTNQSFAGSVHAWMTTTWTSGDWSWTGASFKIKKIAPLLPPLAAKAFVYAMGLVLLGATLWLMRKTMKAGVQDRLTQCAEFSCFLLIMLLMSPMSHRTHFTTLLLPAWTVGLHFWRRPSRRLRACLAAVLLLQLVSLRLLSVDLSYIASWCGAQMLSTLALLFACWFVIEDRLAAAQATAMPQPESEPKAETSPKAETPSKAAGAPPPEPKLQPKAA